MVIINQQFNVQQFQSQPQQLPFQCSFHHQQLQTQTQTQPQQQSLYAASATSVISNIIGNIGNIGTINVAQSAVNTTNTPTTIKIDPYLSSSCYNGITNNPYPQTLPIHHINGPLPFQTNHNENNHIYYTTTANNVCGNNLTIKSQVDISGNYNNNNNNTINDYSALTIPATITSVPPQPQQQISCCILPTSKLTIEPKWCSKSNKCG